METYGPLCRPTWYQSAWKMSSWGYGVSYPPTGIRYLITLTQSTPPDFPLVSLTVLPFYHTYGVHMACFRYFTTPATYVIVPRWDVELVLRSIPR